MPFHSGLFGAPAPVPQPAPTGVTTGQIIGQVSTAALNILGNILGQREARRAQPGVGVAPVTTVQRTLGGQSGLVLFGLAAVIAFFLLRR